MKKLLVIIPTYNEASNIENLINSIFSVSQTLKEYSLNILVLDDSSPDGTADIVKRLKTTNKNIYLLSGQKQGIGKALLRGIKYSLSHIDSDITILMDGDMSHDPKDIPTLLDKLDRNNDLVIGSRYVTGGSIDSRWPIKRKLISFIANQVAHRLVGISKNIKDLTSGFKAIKTDSLKQLDLDSINATGYVFEVSFLHAFLAKGFNVSEIPITFKERTNGKSKMRIKDIIEFLYRSYKLSPNAPIQRFVRFGLVGASGTIVNLAVLTFLVKVISLNTYLSVAIAIEISIVSNFFLNHLYTFKGYGSFKLQRRTKPLKDTLYKLIKFNLATLGGATISFITFSILYKYAHLHYLLSDVLSIIIALSWNYFMSIKYIWKTIDK